MRFRGCGPGPRSDLGPAGRPDVDSLALDGNGTFNSENRRTVEGFLDHLADERGIDRTNEHSFSDADFPKTIVQAQAHRECEPGECRDRCASGQCGEPLGGECPHIEPDPIDLQDTARGDLTPGSDN